MYDWWHIYGGEYSFGNYEYGYTLVDFSLSGLSDKLSEGEINELLDEISSLINKKLERIQNGN